MVKKHTGKVIQMLSPENYIRKKARTLPIFECLVNPGWEVQGFANVIVSRIHTNGNVTACFYLVDTYCLGVKDSFYLFNVIQTEYQEKLVSREELESFIKINYELAHNIVHAGLEFAEEYGFKPCKDFTSITRFMLEEDTDDVELIDIECGKNGKPFYISGPFDDQAKINRILAQLERTAGPENYDYLTEAEIEEDEDWEEDDEDDDDEDDEFRELSFDQKKQLFKELESKKGSPNQEESIHYLKLATSIFKEFTDFNLVEKYYEDYVDDLSIPIQADQLPDEMLGIVPGSMQISDEMRSLFIEINNLTHEKPKKANKLLDEFRKHTPDIPASYYLELNILYQNNSKKYNKKLAEYSKMFPDYALIKLLLMEHEISSENIKQKMLENAYDLNYFFPERSSLHAEEMFAYLIFKFFLIEKIDDASHLEALYFAIDEVDFQEDILKVFDSIVIMAKLQFVYNHLKNERHGSRN